MKVLHIETSLVLQKMVKTSVVASACEYDFVDTIENLDKKLTLTSYDLIITALNVSGLVGEEIIEFIFEKTMNTTPVFVLTSSDDVELRKKLYKMGVVEYRLKKDFDHEFIRSYIKALERDLSLTETIRSTKIAVIDDSKVILNQFKILFDKYDIEDVGYFLNATSFYGQELNYDLFLIDLVLPDSSGEVITEKIKAENPDSIVIMVSSITNNKTISLALSSGADDFINKPFDSLLLLTRLKTHIHKRKLIKDLEEKNIELEKLSITDGLTGVFNHEYILEKLNLEVYRAERYKHDLSIILFDLDYFKKVNDTYGHQVGDETLRTFAQSIKKRIRVSDIIGRYGGEEFLLILPDTTYENAYLTADKIRSATEKLKFSEADLSITVSGGVSSIVTGDSLMMLTEADKNMYDAKNNGRNQIK